MLMVAPSCTYGPQKKGSPRPTRHSVTPIPRWTGVRLRTHPMHCIDARAGDNHPFRRIHERRAVVVSIARASGDRLQPAAPVHPRTRSANPIGSRYLPPRLARQRGRRPAAAPPVCNCSLPATRSGHCAPCPDRRSRATRPVRRARACVRASRRSRATTERCALGDTPRPSNMCRAASGRRRRAGSARRET